MKKKRNKTVSTEGKGQKGEYNEPYDIPFT